MAERAFPPDFFIRPDGDIPRGEGAAFIIVPLFGKFRIRRGKNLPLIQTVIPQDDHLPLTESNVTQMRGMRKDRRRPQNKTCINRETLEKFRKMPGITRERVRQIEAKAIRKLINEAREHGMEGLFRA